MKFFNEISFTCVCLMLLACSQNHGSNMSFDLQGHRGARGLMPENTIPAFLKAIDLGVNTIEMDLAVTKNHQLLVSHEHYFSSEYCRMPDGSDVKDSIQTTFNIYQMDYFEIKKFDCGLRIHPRFPNQEKLAVHKPLLVDVIDKVESYSANNSPLQLAYNIEIKSLPEGDDLYHPKPNIFSDLVFNELNRKIDWSRVTIQSFDFRILKYFNDVYPEVQLAALVENKFSIHENLRKLGFTPTIYSCDYVLLSRENVDQLHSQGIKVIPWTVNEIADMKRLIDWGVDGLITDYPDRYNSIIYE